MDAYNEAIRRLFISKMARTVDVAGPQREGQEASEYTYQSGAIPPVIRRRDNHDAHLKARAELATSDAERTYRKQRPLYSGLLRYFPDALMEVAYTSFIGNEQHNAGEPLHWAKEKSTDELDALMRHLKDAGTRDTDGVRHSAKIAWRALANLQREIEAEQAAKKKDKIT